MNANERGQQQKTEEMQLIINAKEILLVVPDDASSPVQFGAGHERVQGIGEDNEMLGPVEVGALVVARQIDIHTG